MFKFKSLAVIAACAAAMVLVSCEKEKEFPITPGETQLTTTAEGGEISLSVICEQSDWQWSFAEEDASQWCTGKKDKDKLVLTVAPNYTGKDRSLTIILSSSNSSAEVVLTQGSSVTFYKVAVPDFSNMDAADNVGKSLVYEVSDKDGKVIGVLCNEYIPAFSNSNRATVFYPAVASTDGQSHIQAEGKVLDNWGSVTWDAAKGSCTYSAGSASKPAAELYLMNGKEPKEEPFQNASIQDATLKEVTITDKAGKVYPVTKVGTQYWMRGNLAATTYSDGSAIATGLTKDDWKAATSGACCITGYEDAADASDKAKEYLAKYGILYNWYAVSDAKGIAPEGSHVPSYDEWNQYYQFVGGSKALGNNGPKYLKLSGMQALFAGARDLNGKFVDRGDYGYWWSSSKYTGEDAAANPDHASHALLGYSFDEETYDEYYFFTPNGYAPYREAYSLRLVVDYISFSK